MTRINLRRNTQFTSCVFTNLFAWWVRKSKTIHELSRNITKHLSCSFVWFRGSLISVAGTFKLRGPQRSGSCAGRAFVAGITIPCLAGHFKDRSPHRQACFWQTSDGSRSTLNVKEPQGLQVEIINYGGAVVSIGLRTAAVAWVYRAGYDDLRGYLATRLLRRAHRSVRESNWASKIHTERGRVPTRKEPRPPTPNGGVRGLIRWCGRHVR